MDLVDDPGLGDRQQIIAPLEIPGMLGKPLSTEVGLGESVSLDHGPHKQEDQE